MRVHPSAHRHRAGSASKAFYLLDPEAVARAETLGLHARFLVEGYTSGEHRSPYHGFAVEFAQHREYTHGDDMRHLDWKVLGRTERYFIKQYQQETNYVAHLLLDGSESMDYGSGRITKLQYGKMIAACLAYLIVQQHDAVALSIFDETLRHNTPRRDNQRGLVELMEQLASFAPARPSNIGVALQELAGRIRRKGIVIVVSDLFDTEEAILSGLQRLRHTGSEVVVFHVMDSSELEFPFDGLVAFEGIEDRETIVTRPHEIKESYLEEVRAFQRRVRGACERNNCHYQLVDTGRALNEVLAGYLTFRLRSGAR